MLRFPSSILLGLALAAAMASTTTAQEPRVTPEGVKIISEPYTDEVWTKTAQEIPGKLWFAYCDKTPEQGFHIEGQKDCVNHCSCTFNKCIDDNYFDNFRSKECLTTCYTKSQENNRQGNFCCDTWANNGTLVPINDLMIGYTFVGNWYSYTVDVKEPGTYAATFYGSSHHGGTLAFDVDYVRQVSNVAVTSTGWWHNYNVWDDLFSLTFPSAGLHVVTVHIESISPPPGFKEWGNLVWMDLVKTKEGEEINKTGNVRGRSLE